MSSDRELEQRYKQTRKQLQFYNEKYQRKDNAARLIAVSKFHPADNILTLANLGQRDFGENYLQEAIDKIEALTPKFQTRQHDVRWHFIGHIQSKKCKQLAHYFDWIHTVDNEKVVQKLDQYRDGRPPLYVLIQLNLQNEPSKSGIAPEQLSELASLIAQKKNLVLRGLMIIPQHDPDFETQRQVFAQCKLLLDDLNAQGYALDQLSMGMTNDMEAAVCEQSTLVRVGTAIFGKRPEQRPA